MERAWRGEFKIHNYKMTYDYYFYLCQTFIVPYYLNHSLFRLPKIYWLQCTICQPQAMFKVLHRSPPIPESLSPEGKDFLQCCFQRNPAERPSAIVLLDHPFVRNWNDQNVPMQALSRLNLLASITLISVLAILTLLYSYHNNCLFSLTG